VWLVGGAFAVGAAALARYDLLLEAAALTVLVGLLVGRQPGMQVAHAIAFGTPAASVVGLWLVLNALATGNALTFLGQDARILASPGTTIHTGFDPGAALAAFVLMAPAACVGLLGAGLAAAAGHRSGARPVLVLSVALLAVPLVAIGGSVLSGTSPGLLVALPWLPLGILLLVGLGAALEFRFWKPIVVSVALLGALVPVIPMSSRDEWGQGYAAFASALMGSPAAPMWSEERAVASAMREASRGRDILLDDRRDALVAMLVGAPDHLIATADADFGAVVSDPRGVARLILVQTPGPNEAPPFDPINATWPRLYADGAPWAELVGEWPVTGDPLGRYRLYRVLDAPP
jgi:hypothetical protein